MVVHQNQHVQHDIHLNLILPMRWIDLDPFLRSLYYRTKKMLSPLASQNDPSDTHDQNSMIQNLKLSYVTSLFVNLINLI